MSARDVESSNDLYHVRECGVVLLVIIRFSCLLFLKIIVLRKRFTQLRKRFQGAVENVILGACAVLLLLAVKNVVCMGG